MKESSEDNVVDLKKLMFTTYYSVSLNPATNAVEYPYGKLLFRLR